MNLIKNSKGKLIYDQEIYIYIYIHILYLIKETTM